MSKPIVAIVGRPNVGKSTLFNMIAGERIAIVKDTPGVTRDRIYAEVSWLNHNFTLMDTGGIEPETSNQMLRSMREQAEMAIEMADVVMFVVDVQQGVLDADYKVADMLRKAHKVIVLVVNKVDNYDKMLPDVYEFYNLGIGDPHPISSLNKMGLGDMLDEVTALFPKDLEEAARLDGCNIGQTFLFIMAPLTRSSMVALGIFTAVFAYKDLMWPLICNKDVMPLSAALAKMQGQYTNNYPQLMAASLLACIPMIVLYLIFQKQFIEGIATSGGKL